MGVSSETSGMRGVESALRKLVLAAATLLGVGYVVVNIPIVVLLGHRFSQTPMSSMQNISELASITLFLMASILLMIVGGFLIIGGLQYYRGSGPGGVMFLGSLLASFYLLCLGVGSMFMVSQGDLGVILLIISPVLTMGAIAVYMGNSIPFKLVGSITGIIGGILLAIAVFNHHTLEFFFDWDVPFPGPFMSIAIVEAVVVVLGPVTAFIYSILANRKEEPIAHAFLSMVALVYGIGTFIASQVLAFSFLNLLWKAHYPGEVFYGLPQWFFGTVAFWSASLFLLMVGGIILIASSCMGFIFSAQEFAQL